MASGDARRRRRKSRDLAATSPDADVTPSTNDPAVSVTLSLARTWHPWPAPRSEPACHESRRPRSAKDEKSGNIVMYSLTRTGDLLRRRVAVLVPQLVADLGQQLLVAELDARVERVVADDAPVARRHRDAAAARVVR